MGLVLTWRSVIASPPHTAHMLPKTTQAQVCMCACVSEREKDCVCVCVCVCVHACAFITCNTSERVLFSHYSECLKLNGHPSLFDQPSLQRQHIRLFVCLIMLACVCVCVCSLKTCSKINISPLLRDWWCQWNQMKMFACWVLLTTTLLEAAYIKAQRNYRDHK